MEFKEVIAITGMSGLYKVINTRQDGMIVKNLENGLTKFAPSRLHEISLLDNISMYTIEDSEPLKVVFQNIQTTESDNPLPAHNAENEAIINWFQGVLPNYDPEQVKVSDIRKLIKWYNILKPTGVFNADPA